MFKTFLPVYTDLDFDYKHILCLIRLHMQHVMLPLSGTTDFNTLVIRAKNVV